MGYWAAGHLLVGEPKIQAMSGLPAGMNWALYKAKDSPIWLLDTFRSPPDKHGPFSEYIWRGGDKDELEPLVPGYAAIVKTLAVFGLSMSITIWLGLSRQLSELLGQRVFTFVSDDDTTQMTCVCDQGVIQRLHCDYELLDLVWEGGRFVITPQLLEEDPDIKPDAKLLAALAAVGNVVVREAVAIPGGGRLLHNIVLTDWPADAGKPQQLVDLGTGDDFLDLDSRFDIVASGPGASPEPPSARAAGSNTAQRKGFWRRLFGG